MNIRLFVYVLNKGNCVLILKICVGGFEIFDKIFDNNLNFFEIFCFFCII